MTTHIEREFVSRKEAAKICNVSWQTIHNWQTAGAFPGSLRSDPDDIQPDKSDRTINRARHVFIYREVREFARLALGKPLAERVRIAKEITDKRVES